MRILTFLSSFLPVLLWSQGTIIYSTDFQQGIPANFTLVDNDGNTPNDQVAEYNQAWICVVDPENTMDSVAASTSYFTPADTANRWMITPAISLDLYGNYLSWEAKSQDASYPDSYMVLLSTTDTQISSFTDTLANIGSESFEWTSREIDLTTLGYDNQTVYFAFVLKTYDGFKLYVDDIQVRSLDDTYLIENEINPLIAYPNPATDIVHFQGVSSNSKIIVYAINGVKMYEGVDSKLDVSLWNSGIYTIQVLSQGKSMYTLLTVE